MTAARLTLALDAGAVHLPTAGEIVVYRPPAGSDLSALPKDRIRIVHGAAPDHAYWAALGYRVNTEAPDTAAGAVVCLPRARAQARDLVARALAHGGPVIVDGQKTDGIDALYRDLAPRGVLSPAFSKAHGKCYQFSAPPEALADWVLPELTRTPSGWVTAPGLFSADGPDPGSVALARHLPKSLSGRVADLGAGWGYLAFQILERPGVTEVVLVEAEAAGIAAARANIADPRAQFHWADVTKWSDPAPFDHVVTNPPFHIGRRAEPALGATFIATAAGLLAKRGTLWLVANRHLPYEAALTGRFGTVETLEEAKGYKIIVARHPRAATSPPSIGSRSRR